jgi:hypothetical protein
MVIVCGISSHPLERYFTQPLSCSWGDLHFCHSFLIVPDGPVPLLEQDLLSQLKTQILLPSPHPSDNLCCPLLQEQVDPTVWTEGMTVGQAKMALPIQTKLRDPSQFPHQKLYPLQA